MRKLEECDEYICSDKIPISEKGKKIVFVNPKHLKVRKIQIDKCVFEEDEGERCDWLLINQNNDNQHFVELKGHGITKAISQIENTMIKLRYDIKNSSRFAYVVCSKFPSGISQRVSEEKDRFRRDYSCILKIKEKILIAKI